MKSSLCAYATLAVYMFASAGCATGKSINEPIYDSDIKSVLAKEGIVNVLSTEREDADEASYFIVTFDSRNFGRWCRADRADISLRKSDGVVVVASIDKSELVSFDACDRITRQPEKFAAINSEISPQLLSMSMGDIENFARNETNGVPISATRGELVNIISTGILRNLVSVSVHSSEAVYFQFDDQRIFPAKLGVEMKYLDGKLIGISLDDLNSYEITSEH